MATLRGERFQIDLDSTDEEGDTASEAPAFVGDVQERVTSTAAPPSFKNNTTGFPEHKKRTGTSRFKQNRTGEGSNDDTAKNSIPIATPDSSRGPLAPTPDKLECQKIDAENKRRLAEMSDSEIDQERQELFAGLGPALIQTLLRRSNIDDEPAINNTMPPTSELKETPKKPKKRPSHDARKVSFALPDEEPEKKRRPSAVSHSLSSEDIPRLEQADGDNDSKMEAVDEDLASEPSVHFPKPPAAPELDPNSSSFLDDLHEKYFPDLAHDPSKLAWMAPATKEEDSSYDPLQAGLEPSHVRFSFKGALIPQSKANSISTGLGLHHHGDAPSAAGYTIAELAMLSRSSYPAQRCIAFQTLGRILYRLGTGEFGNENNMDASGPDGDRARLTKGLWAAVKQNRVLETLIEEAKKENGHQTSIALAQEAVWNWRRGGGRELQAV